MTNIVNDIVNRAISVARLMFGGDDGIFNTACFQVAMRQMTSTACGDVLATRLLSSHPALVRLTGGCHWRYAR